MENARLRSAAKASASWQAAALFVGLGACAYGGGRLAGLLVAPSPSPGERLHDGARYPVSVAPPSGEQTVALVTLVERCDPGRTCEATGAIVRSLTAQYGDRLHHVQEPLAESAAEARGEVPALFVNGRRLEGPLTEARTARLIDRELAHAEVALLRGAPPARLYDVLVMGDARHSRHGSLASNSTP